MAAIYLFAEAHPLGFAAGERWVLLPCERFDWPSAYLLESGAVVRIDSGTPRGFLRADFGDGWGEVPRAELEARISGIFRRRLTWRGAAELGLPFVQDSE